MEDALVHDDGNYTLGETKFIVLILVLMEDALVRTRGCRKMLCSLCLNPCFNGRCTSTEIKKCSEKVSVAVLILVLMEDALVQLTVKISKNILVS